MRNLPWLFLAATSVIFIGSSSEPEGAEQRESCAIAPFEWDIVGSNVTREGRLIRVDYMAIGTATHSGVDCPLDGEAVVVRDRSFVLFEPLCAQDGTTPLRGTDPLDYGGGMKMEFRGPITGVVTCGSGGLRSLEMDINAKSEKGARLFLRLVGEVDLTAKLLTRLAVTDGTLAVR